MQPPSRSRTAEKSNGFIERVHSTLLDEHLRVKSRSWCEALDEMKADMPRTREQQEVPTGAPRCREDPFTVFNASIPKAD